MRTVKEPDVRKQEILDGAIRVFAKKGYDKTTITDIARELNISQGLCYRYFNSKEDIYDAAIEKYADIIVSENLKKRNNDKPIREWIDGIKDVVKELINSEMKDTELYKLFHSNDSKRIHNELCLKVASKLLPYVQDVLKKAKERGEISIEDP